MIWNSSISIHKWSWMQSHSVIHILSRLLSHVNGQVVTETLQSAQAQNICYLSHYRKKMCQLLFYSINQITSLLLKTTNNLVFQPKWCIRSEMLSPYFKLPVFGYSLNFSNDCVIFFSQPPETKMRSSSSCVWIFATPWTIALQAPLSMGILRARILEWVAMPSSRGSSQSRDWTQVSSIGGRFFIFWATREAPP